MEIRDAVPEDAEAACLVLRRSIAELCRADHGDDVTILTRWLDNKTPAIVGGWIVQPGNHMLLAVAGGAILAVGSVTDEGQVTLNYVSPDARFRGISTALLAALEARARERGRDAIQLTSTETARRFYLARGYAESGPPETKFGTSGYPMRKSLRP
jgi:GNAT superfamily N-acetyltransferase